LKALLITAVFFTILVSIEHFLQFTEQNYVIRDKYTSYWSVETPCEQV